jgi:hypothetical protein
MNDRPDDRAPAERFDELLSAELDGELRAAATELGATPDELDTLREGRAEARRGALAGAAVRYGELEPLDDVARARMVRGALGHLAQGIPATDELTPRRARRARWLAPSAAAAAALALVVGIGVALQDGDDARPAAVPTGDAQTEGAGAETLADLGDLTDAGRLRGLLGEGGDGFAAPNQESGGAGAEDSTPDLDAADAGATTTGAARATPEDCLPGLRPDGPVPMLVGTATYEGAPAFVAVLELPDRILAWVFAPDCRFLNAQSLARS